MSTANSATSEYVERLVDAGLLSPVDPDARPIRYAAHTAEVAVTIDGARGSLELTDELLSAVVASRDDGDIETFVEREGITALAHAIDLAAEYVDGTVNHRIAARELDVSPLEAELVLQALAPIVAEELPESRHVTPADRPGA